MARKSLTTPAALPRMMAFVREDLGEALASMQAPASKGRTKAPKKATKWVPSEWYRKAVAADRAAETRAHRTAARPKSPRANAQAVQYARFLARRDGVALPEHTEGYVCWRQCEHGWRPHRVSLWEVRVDQWGYHQGRVGCQPVADIDLPNWDAAWEVVVDLSEPEPALAIAA